MPPFSPSVASAPFTPSITSMTFVPTSFCTLIASTGMPCERTKFVTSFHVSTTSATSPTSTGPDAPCAIATRAMSSVDSN